MKIIIRATIITIIVACGFFYFHTVTFLSKSGEVIAELKQDVAGLERDNSKLIMDLSGQASLNEIEQKALAQGLIAGAKFVYISQKPSSLAVSKR
ncbi:MAG: hypothetical protein ABH896_01120 [Candidatus Jacksonbacteria bacterium]